MDSITSRVSRRRFLSVTGLTGLGLAGAALVGCGEDDDADTPSSTDSGSSASATGTASASATTVASSATPVAGTEMPAEFVFANDAEPGDLGPWFGGFSQGLVTKNIYEPLVEPFLTLNEDGTPNWTIRGALAESWEKTGDATFRIKLREGVTFHTGEEWNADAAIASFHFLTNEDIITPLQKTNPLASLLPRFEKVDDHTIEVDIARGGLEALTLYMQLYYVGLPPSITSGTDGAALLEHPVGTGPLQFMSWSRGSDIVLEPFADYWDSSVEIPFTTVKYVTRPEPSVRALTIDTGEAHFAFNVGGEAGTSLPHWFAGAGFQSTMVRLNNVKPPFDDIRVRRAANYAIDRDAILEQIFRGTARPTTFFAFQSSSAEPFPYDPEMATSLLSEAGAEGAEVELAYGEFRIPEEEELAQIYKGFLDAVGFNVTLNRLERAAYNEASAAEFANQPHMLIESTSSGNYFDVEGSLADKFGCEGSGTFCVPEVEEQWAGLSSLSFEDRASTVAEIARILQEDYASRIWIAAVQQVHGLAPFVDPSGMPTNLFVRMKDMKFA